MKHSVKFDFKAAQASDNFHASIVQGSAFPVDIELDTDKFLFDKLVEKAIKSAVTAAIKRTGVDSSNQPDLKAIYTALDASVTVVAVMSKEQKIVVATAVQAMLLKADKPAVANWAYGELESLNTVKARALADAHPEHAAKLVEWLTAEKSETALRMADLVTAAINYEPEADEMPDLD